MYACNVHARVIYDEVLLSGLSSKQYRIRTAQAQEHCPFSHALSASFSIVKSSTLCSGEEGAGGAAGHLLVLYTNFALFGVTLFAVSRQRCDSAAPFPSRGPPNAFWGAGEARQGRGRDSEPAIPRWSTANVLGTAPSSPHKL